MNVARMNVAASRAPSTLHWYRFFRRVWDCARRRMEWVGRGRARSRHPSSLLCPRLGCCSQPSSRFLSHVSDLALLLKTPPHTPFPQVCAQLPQPALLSFVFFPNLPLIFAPSHMHPLISQVREVRARLAQRLAQRALLDEAQVRKYVCFAVCMHVSAGACEGCFFFFFFWKLLQVCLYVAIY